MSIQNDGDFDTEHGIVEGSGTAADPYLIEGWEIDASPGGCSSTPCRGIAVQNTSASFIIRNVKISGEQYEYGISLSDVKNARVEGASIAVVGDGISVVSSTNLTIFGNSIVASDAGITLTGCRNVYVLTNNVSHGGQGIMIEDSSRVTLLDNVLSGNNANGIVLSHGTNSTLERNTIAETAFRAIGLFDSSDIVITRNKIVGTGEECLYVLGGSGNSVIQNDVSDCKWGGISVNTSNYNVITDNVVTATLRGITLYEACQNLVARNRAANGSAGIAITSSTDCNLIVDNNATRSTLGGLLLARMETQQVTNGLIEHNVTCAVASDNKAACQLFTQPYATGI
jgi:parallel beta-helix repeat protein